MANEKELFIGDRSSFAIRYVPGNRSNNGKYLYAYCHLVLGGQVIGDINEICFLNSWAYALEKLKDKIKNNFGDLFNNEFGNRSETEIFELIVKANQLEERYDPEYSYLPVLDNKVWHSCHVALDETIDAYFIAMIGEGNALKFIWKGWREPCLDHQIDKLFTVTVNKDLVIETMERCLFELKNIGSIP